MKVGKKASVKAIEYCTKLSGRKLGASTSWEQCFEIAMEGFLLGVHTLCERDGDETVLTLYKEPGEKEDVIETFRLPNDDCFDWKLMEHQWNFIWKYVTEWLIKNHKKLAKTTKKKRTKKVTPAEIKARLEEAKSQIKELKAAIKTAKGKDKKRAIEDYNRLARMIEEYEQQLETIQK